MVTRTRLSVTLTRTLLVLFNAPFTLSNLPFVAYLYRSAVSSFLIPLENFVA
jgi:hypothetical protein